MCKELEKWPDSAKPTVPVARRANSVINQPVLCQGSCSATFKAVWLAWSRQAYAIHFWAVGTIARTFLKQCLPCAALGFKSRFQRIKYLGEENACCLVSCFMLLLELFLLGTAEKSTENGLSDGFFPCLLCRIVVLNLFLLDEPHRPAMADGNNSHCLSLFIWAHTYRKWTEHALFWISGYQAKYN